MNGLLCYFSGTGNTKWIADRLCQELEMSGYHAELTNIEKVNSLDLRGYDFLIIGTPVYAEAPPPLVEDFVRRLPMNHGIIQCMVYSNQGAVTPCTVKRLSRILSAKGYPITMEALLRMPNNYYFGAGIRPTAAKIDRYLRAAEQQIHEIAITFVAGTRRLSSASPLQLGYGKIVASVFKGMVPRLARKLMAGPECNGCGLCARRCPRHNIELVNQRAIFAGSCMLCTRCVHICPVNAIRYDGKKVEQTQRSIIQTLEPAGR
ncbi:MAG: EFR1 family ferrodoxin [Bacillota bacterium]